jgi:hypothetical protein
MGLHIKGYGKAQKTLVENGKTIILTFNNALHCPDVTSDLISISQLDKQGFKIMFGDGCVKFFDSEGTHFLTGHGTDGLYKLPERPSALVVKSRSLHHPVDLSMWHCCLAHAGISRLDLLGKKDLVDGFNVKPSKGLEGKCVDCLIGAAV